jgi:signal transduction histidine kinase
MIHELREDTRITSNAKLSDALGIISDCADHLYSLITDILDFEMLMRDQPALNVSSLSLTDEVLQVSHTPPWLLSLSLSGLSVSWDTHVDLFLVDQVYNVLAPQAKEKKIAFEKEIDVKHNARIGDARRLRQVLYNLAANALKFTPEGGTVRISVHDSAQEGKNSEGSGIGDKTDNNDDDLVVLQVSDTGIGIADSLMPSLFTVSSSRSLRLDRANMLT